MGDDGPDDHQLAGGLTYRTSWAKPVNWSNPLLDFWDDFSADGKVEERDQAGVDAPVGSLAVKLEIPAGGTEKRDFSFDLALPKPPSWSPGGEGIWFDGWAPTKVVHLLLETITPVCYADAWDVALKIGHELPELEDKTLLFVKSFCASDLPDAVKEAALYNVSTLGRRPVFGRRMGGSGAGRGFTTTKALAWVPVPTSGITNRLRPFFLAT